MLNTQIAPLRIIGSDASLSQGQKTFNSQIQQIEKLRTRLAAWEAAATAYQAKFAREMLPLVNIALEQRLRLLHRLDSAAAQKDLSRGECRQLSALAVDLAAEILADSDNDDVKAIYNKHSKSDYDTEEAEQLQGLKGLMEDMLDVDLGDDADLNSPADIMRQAQAKLREQQAHHAAQRQARQDDRAQRKKSAKQQEKEQQAKADEQQISQSIREIYRKLVSALHPDREPDPQERERKTGLMQRINQAYDTRNLLQLLELQLELEHIDKVSITKIDEERLRHYNAILKEQIAELTGELMHIELSFREQFALSPQARLKPETVLRDLSLDITLAAKANREMEQTLRSLEETKNLKAWLKAARKKPDRSQFDW